MSSQVSLQKLFDVVDSKVGGDRSYLEGQILTIIDGIFSDTQQREAVKSIVRSAMWSSVHSRDLAEIFSQYAERNGLDFTNVFNDDAQQKAPSISWFN